MDTRLAKELSWDAIYIFLALLLGLFAYGIGIFLYVTAQRELGAARTSAYYAVAPFIGVGVSYVIFLEPVTFQFLIALALMLVGTYFAVVERHEHQHCHQPVEHEHKHNHADGHHNHSLLMTADGEHSHKHVHDLIIHSHGHTPDLHHMHQH